MKKLLLLFSILLSLFTNGQTSVYRPFPTNFGNWVYQYYDDFGFPTAAPFSIFLSGDTIIAGINYKKIPNVGVLREASKIVYFVPDTSSTEYILYDFNLGLGDTIIHPFGGASCSNDTVIIEQVDSILASDGYHRQLHLSSFAIWIEGIGSIYYLFQPAELLCVSGNSSLECMINDSLFIYPSASSLCTVSVPEQISKPIDIFIYPNPATESIQLKSLQLSSQTIEFEIYINDLFGKVVKHTEVTYKKDKIDISSLKKGIYFIKILNQQHETLYTSKIIKL